MTETVTLSVQDTYSISWLNKNQSFIQKINATINSNLTKDIINKAQKIIENSYKQQYKEFTINNYRTRAQKEYSDTIYIKIDEFSFRTINDFRLFFATMYPNIDKYFNKSVASNINETYLQLFLKDNSLYIRGNVLSIYHLIISNSLIKIFIQCSAKNLTIDQFNQNIKQIEYSKELEQETCSICLEGFNKKHIISETSCGHKFHYHCIYQWLCVDSSRPDCPCCRTSQLKLTQ